MYNRKWTGTPSPEELVRVPQSGRPQSPACSLLPKVLLPPSEGMEDSHRNPENRQEVHALRKSRFTSLFGGRECCLVLVLFCLGSFIFVIQKYSLFEKLVSLFLVSSYSFDYSLPSSLINLCRFHVNMKVASRLLYEKDATVKSYNFF